jgi:TatA/E family protein of Tat protein translocase
VGGGVATFLCGGGGPAVIWFFDDIWSGEHTPQNHMTTTFLVAGFLGLGGPELAVVFVLLLLLFGAKKLPELARGMGRSLGEFKKAREEFEQEITKGGEDVNTELRKTRDDVDRDLKGGVHEPAGKQQYPS